MPDMTPLGESAHTMHEMMMSYVDAGFTRKEAFDLVKSIMVEMVSVMVNPKGDNG